MRTATDLAVTGPARPVPVAAPSGPRPTLSRDEAERMASLLRVVSDPTRLQLLSLIQHSPDEHVRVADLARALDLRQPTVTHHLNVLDEAGIVVRERHGREVWCQIVPERIEEIADLLR